MVRRNVQPDTFLDWATVAELSGTSTRPPTVAKADIRPDPLVDLLTCPIRALTAPLGVESSILADTIYLVADDHQAATVRAKGGLPYTPEEVDILWELYQAVRPEVWAERLRLIHEAKKRFHGRVEP